MPETVSRPGLLALLFDQLDQHWCERIGSSQIKQSVVVGWFG